MASPKSIWLIFILLDVCILICYFFGYFFNIYSRPIALLALLALMLLSRRDAIFLNVIFALMMFSIDRFSNFSNIEQYETALSSTPLLTFSAGMVGIFVGSKVKTRLRSFLTGFAVSIPILVMVACLEFNRGIGVVYLLLYGLEAGVLSSVLFMALLPVYEMLFNRITDYRLRELTDHDAPLMREMKERAMERSIIRSWWRTLRKRARSRSAKTRRLRARRRIITTSENCVSPNILRKTRRGTTRTTSFRPSFRWTLSVRMQRRV